MNTRLFNLYKTAKTGHIVTEKWNYFLIVQSNVHCKPRSRLRDLKEQKYTLYELEHDYKISNTLQLTVK